MFTTDEVLLTANPKAGSTQRAEKWGKVPDIGACAVISPIEHKDLEQSMKILRNIELE